MSTDVETYDKRVEIEVIDIHSVVETIDVNLRQVVEVPITTQQHAALEVYSPGVEIQTIFTQSPLVIEAAQFLQYADVLVPGPQGIPGDTKFYVGPTAPADTSLIWVDTS